MANLNAGDDLPAADHVLRYCSPSHVDGQQIAPSAFEIRTGENYLSVDWLEFFNGHQSLDACINQVRQAVRNRLQVRDNGRFVKIQVGVARQANHGRAITYEPLANFPNDAGKSHAGIHRGKNRLTFALALRRTITQHDIYQTT